MGRGVGITAFCLAILATGALPGGDPDPATLDRLHRGFPPNSRQPLSSISCAAASCHGGPRPGVVNRFASRGNAYPLWLERDPHARSWRTICGEESEGILNRLGIMRDGQVVDLAGFNNCLACHNSMPLEATSQLTNPHPSGSWRAEGVGCAACHGLAEDWKNEHYLASWNPWRARQDGFVAMEDPLTRARKCASCHVGDSDRDMNHDLIAAGHPALRFEMSFYHAALPKHWREPMAQQAANSPGQWWIAGAIASADAWLALLQGRAEQSTAASTWPEFSVYDCASCHHSLGLDNQRARGEETEATGPLRISSWNRFGVLQLLERQRREGTLSAAGEEALRGLEGLRSLLESNAAPPAQRVAELAARTRGNLAQWSSPYSSLDHPPSRPVALWRPFDTDPLDDLLRQATVSVSSYDSWENAVQLYRLTAASQQRRSDQATATLDRQLAGLRRGLAFPADRDSPRYSVSRPAGPPATREEIRALGAQIHEALRTENDFPLPPPR